MEFSREIWRGGGANSRNRGHQHCGGQGCMRDHELYHDGELVHRTDKEERHGGQACLRRGQRQDRRLMMVPVTGFRVPGADT